jgi:asparagine synthase (glutamine-hydrolysing)
VALSGDGADELHAGYNKHYAHYRALHSAAFNLGIKISSPIFDLFPKSRNSSIANKARQASRYSKGILKNHSERYWYWCTFADQKTVNNILKNKVNNRFELNRKEILKYIDADFNSILYTDMKLVLTNDMLFKADMMSMSHGLEVRVPMLDHTVVDFVASLPSEYKIDNKIRKKLLRSSYHDVLPTEILQKRKHGFEVPLLPWLKNELKPLINEVLNKKDILDMGILNFDAVQELEKKVNSANPADSPVNLWNVLVFQYWCKKYFL